MAASAGGVSRSMNAFYASCCKDYATVLRPAMEWALRVLLGLELSTSPDIRSDEISAGAGTLNQIALCAAARRLSSPIPASGCSSAPYVLIGPILIER